MCQCSCPTAQILITTINILVFNGDPLRHPAGRRDLRILSSGDLCCQLPGRWDIHLQLIPSTFHRFVRKWKKISVKHPMYLFSNPRFKSVVPPLCLLTCVSRLLLEVCHTYLSLEGWICWRLTWPAAQVDCQDRWFLTGTTLPLLWGWAFTFCIHSYNS